MKITWLGQAGLLFETEKTTILIDPYFSDNAASVSGHRKMPVSPSVWDIKPDILLCTHDHIDHYDPETILHFINKDSKITVLSPASVWSKIREIGGKNNYVRVIPGVIWSEHDVTITTVSAVHSDPAAVGFIVEHNHKTYYVTGDTLYCPSCLQIPFEHIDVVCLPINGRGNNMNATDAAKFCDCIHANLAIPIHFGMLDEVDPRSFKWKNTIIPRIYEEMLL